MWPSRGPRRSSSFWAPSPHSRTTTSSPSSFSCFATRTGYVHSLVSPPSLRVHSYLNDRPCTDLCPAPRCRAGLWAGQSFCALVAQRKPPQNAADGLFLLVVVNDDSHRLGTHPAAPARAQESPKLSLDSHRTSLCCSVGRRRVDIAGNDRPLRVHLHQRRPYRWWAQPEVTWG